MWLAVRATEWPTCKTQDGRPDWILAGWLSGLALEESLTLGVICGSRAVGDRGGYRGCPREPELRAIAVSRGTTLP